MADVRCPMCSKPNPAEAEACAYCGARIKPLIIRPAEEAQEPQAKKPAVPDAPRPSTSAPGTDWLGRIRAKAAIEPEADEGQLGGEAEAGEAAGEEASWLSRIGGEGAKVKEVSGAPDQPPPGSDQVVEHGGSGEQASAPGESAWFRRIRERRRSKAASAAEPPKVPKNGIRRAAQGGAAAEPPKVPKNGIRRAAQGGAAAEPTELPPASVPTEEVLSPPPPETPRMTPGPEAQSEDWLGRLRGLGGQEVEERAAPEAAEPHSGEFPGWLSDLDSDAEEAQEKKVPDWLARVRAKQATEPAEPEPAARPDDDTDWLSGLGGESRELAAEAQPSFEPISTDLPAPADELEPVTRPEDTDWLSGLRGESQELAAEAQPSFEPISNDLPAPADELEPAARPDDDIDWLSGLRGESQELAAEAEPAFEPLFPDLPAPADEAEPSLEPIPSDMAAFAVEPGPPETERPLREELFVFEESKTDDQIQAEEPSWRRWSSILEEQGASSGLARPEEQEAEATTEEPSLPTPGALVEEELSARPALVERDPLAFPSLAGESQEEGTPTWLGSETSVRDDSLPHVQPLIIDDDGKTGAVSETAADEAETPAWFRELSPETKQEDEAPTPELAASELAPATLPAWLEAMRPIEGFRSVLEIQSEEERVVEAAGPLAGLPGVLLAEPVVAMPRAPKYGGAQLEITERHFAQEQELRRVVQDEEREVPATPSPRRSLPLVRWAITLAMLMGMILPTVWGSPRFGAPKFVPQEFNRTRDIVQGLAADRAALLILDYEPGYSAELESVVGPFLQDLRQRQLRLVTLTTRPASIALGPRLLARHGFVTGEDVIHLGYLAGGMTAVRLFTDSPRAAFPGPFEDPENARLLGPIERLSDASALVVISSSGERARVWAEQAPPLLGNVPLVMILSAGAEPLVRPYYEAPNPQVDALLTGLPAAMAYEQALGQPMEASSRWSAFGMGMLTAQGALIAGAAVGLVRWLLALRKK